MAVLSPSDCERLLSDDVPYGDLTTEMLGIGAVPAQMTFAARDDMVLALVEEAAAVIRLTGARVDLHAGAGCQLGPGMPILTATGNASSLLRCWKVSQTLVEIWSGVATEAHAIVSAARAVAPGIAVACTRKNVPGTKACAVAAVKAGGAIMHRLGLSETILVFPEHRNLAGALNLGDLAQRLRAAAPEKSLVIEVNEVDDAVAACTAGFDVIQLEKFSPAQVVEVRAQLTDHAGRRVVIAAAGGINAGNAADYARAGADVLVTSAPYLARPRDVQVRITPV